MYNLFKILCILSSVFLNLPVAALYAFMAMSTDAGSVALLLLGIGHVSLATLCLLITFVAMEIGWKYCLFLFQIFVFGVISVFVLREMSNRADAVSLGEMVLYYMPQYVSAISAVIITGVIVYVESVRLVRGR